MDEEARLRRRDSTIRLASRDGTGSPPSSRERCRLIEELMQILASFETDFTLFFRRLGGIDEEEILQVASGQEVERIVRKWMNIDLAMSFYSLRSNESFESESPLGSFFGRVAPRFHWRQD